MSQTKEQSVKSSYTVVYELKNSQWVALGSGGWSEVHLCSDCEDGTFRILAWSVESQEVLLNASVTEKCVYKGSKKPNFHSFQSQTGKFGLGFHKSDEALKQANEFLATVRGVIEQLGKQSKEVGVSKELVDPTATERHLEKKGLINKKDYKNLGVLKILPPKPKKHQGADKDIFDPQEVKHERHGYWDSEKGCFQGNFPPGFDKELSKQFGVTPKQLPRSNAGYKEKIPDILLALKNLLKEKGGMTQVGIFRLAPDGEANNLIKDLINKGENWKDNEFAKDVNLIANLLKVWFRDLPVPLLNQVNQDIIEMSQTIDDVKKAVSKFPEPTQSILLWLWDLCVEVAQHKETNKMGPQNLAIVIGPNLFNTNSFQNPMKAMTFSGKVVVFFQRGIEWRQKERFKG